MGCEAGTSTHPPARWAAPSPAPQLIEVARLGHLQATAHGDPGQC